MKQKCYNKSLLLRVMARAMRVQRETDYAVFIYFSGHVELLTIDIKKSKHNYHTTVWKKELYLSNLSEPADTINRGLEAILNKLKGLLTQEATNGPRE